MRKLLHFNIERQIINHFNIQFNTKNLYSIQNLIFNSKRIIYIFLNVDYFYRKIIIITITAIRIRKTKNKFSEQFTSHIYCK